MRIWWTPVPAFRFSGRAALPLASRRKVASSVAVIITGPARHAATCSSRRP